MATVNKDFKVKNNISIVNTADTATTASHYIVETSSDGVIRPKTLANVRTEIVTTAAVNSAAATTVGTVTTGTWQATVINATYIDTAIARLASPTFTGTPAAPTAAADTNTTQIATTAYVIGQASSVNPSALGAVAIGTSTRYARADHVHPTTGLGLTSGKLSQFAATTSAELAGVISDETGSGALVFATSPTLVTPNIGAATGTSLTTTSTITASTTTGRVSLGLDAGGNVNIGRTDNVASTPYIDFNSGAATVDFDVRIQASGGNGTAGNGTLTVTGVVSLPTLTLTTADTSTAASHYFVETASDGVVRPKTLANVRTEIVTTTAVNSAAATTLGTVTTGTWNASLIGLTYGGTNANLTAINGGVVYSTASAMAITAAGTAGQVLTSNGTSAPTWQTPSTGAGGFDAFLLSGM